MKNRAVSLRFIISLMILLHIQIQIGWSQSIQTQDEATGQKVGEIVESPPAPAPLFPVYKQRKWGLIDRTGKVVISIKYDTVGNYGYKVSAFLSDNDLDPVDTLMRAEPFIHELIHVRVGELWGFINRHGEMVIEPRYEEVYQFYEGLATFKIDGGWGYFDVNGNHIIEPQFAWASRFQNGMANVSVSGKRGIIDITGKLIGGLTFEKQPYWPLDDSTDLIAVKMEDKWGFINRSGIVIKPRFSKALGFSEGLASVFIGEKGGYIDTSGDFVIKPQFKSAYHFFRGFASIRNRRKPGLIDTTGKIIVEPGVYDDIIRLKRGEATAKIRVGKEFPFKFGLLDLQGRLSVKPVYDSVNSFSDGLAQVTIKEKSGFKNGFINPHGNLVIPHLYDTSNDFSEGLAVVGQKIKDIPLAKARSEALQKLKKKKMVTLKLAEWKYGFINTKGDLVIPMKFDMASSFKSGLAMVLEGNILSYIDHDGNIIYSMNIAE